MISDIIPLHTKTPETKQSAVCDTSPCVLSKIYQKHTNIATWERKLSSDLMTAVEEFLACNKTKTSVLVVTPETTEGVLCDTFGDDNTTKALREDIALLVDMFCYLFELKEAGLRLTILERAMCPSFHFDRIPCRLVTTYKGVATQWLNNDVIDRSKLGAGNQGKTDEKSGLFNSLNDINQLGEGDVALLKGEHWYENEGAGLVHRSPALAKGERRLLLTLDFISS
ncbi:DUF1826 domain-containing protein [Thalassotalea profundi]|uniref:DUF1826 domain-containing protein n=1 Tax=Thalassotalea profundi TaxID=2036687 RepID=A0ABQ3J440_9GAMM|nr:DUF1826 domain-containing protein [Thalassotalea profundi]GHF00655.1 hypothetical protein GCM10011501_32630 [Thalassotalea profundi]